MKLALLVLILCPLLAAGQYGDKNFIDQNYIEVNGKAEIEITPDLIYIQILINEKDNKARTPLAERERAMVSKLKEIGVDVDKDLLIKEMASNFKYYWLSRDEIILSKDYQLLVRDGKTAAKVFVELEKLNISSVRIEKLDNSQIEKHRREVKVEAIKTAKAKAESLATAIGQTIGRALFIEELESNIQPGNSNTILISGAYRASGLTELADKDMMNMDFEKIKLAYGILCRFELK